MDKEDRREIAAKHVTAVERAKQAGLSRDPADIPELFYSDLMDDVRRVVRSGATRNERGEHVATQATRLLVEAWAAVGTPQEVMATELGITPATLRRHYPDELDNGGELANQRVALRLFEKAMKGDNGCMMYWLSRRAGWTEKKAGDSEDNPLHVKGQTTIDVTALAAQIRAARRGERAPEAIEGGAPGGGGPNPAGEAQGGPNPLPQISAENSSCNQSLQQHAENDVQEAEYVEVDPCSDRQRKLGGDGEELL